jgi:hypothetical protein
VIEAPIMADQGATTPVEDPEVLIHAAVAAKDIQAIKDLLALNPGLVNARQDGVTPLKRACSQAVSSPEVARFLVQNGARFDDVSLCSTENRSAMLDHKSGPLQSSCLPP